MKPKVDIEQRVRDIRVKHRAKLEHPTRRVAGAPTLCVAVELAREQIEPGVFKVYYSDGNFREHVSGLAMDLPREVPTDTT